MPRRLLTRVSGLLAVTLGVVLLSGSTPPADAAPNPWKALGAIRNAWKQSDEAKLALKFVRKTATWKLAEWKRTEGVACPWRSINSKYCWNGWVVADGDLEFYIDTPYGSRYLGWVRDGTLLSAACITSDEDWVRVMWPIPAVPSVFMEQDLLRAFLGKSAKLPVC